MEMNPSVTAPSPTERGPGSRKPVERAGPTDVVAANPPPTPREGGQDAGRIDAERLGRLLGDPGLAWLVERARHRMARGRPLTGTVALSHPDETQRSAAESLLGRPPQAGRSLTVRLNSVDAILRRSGVSPDGLAPAVVALTGPVTPHAEARRGEERAWEEAYAPLGTLDDELADWAGRIRRDGLVRRLARTPEAAGPLVEAAVKALRSLPVVPPMSRATFAARYLSGAHCLDEGAPLASGPVGAPCPHGLPRRRRCRVATRSMGVGGPAQGRRVVDRPLPQPARHPGPRLDGRRG